MKKFIQVQFEDKNYQASYLLEILHEIQFRFQHIPQLAIDLIAEQLKIPRTRIISVIEFYSFFHLEPQGQYQLYISDSITDHMLGKHPLMDYISLRLQVAIGSTRADGLVSLNNTSCTGMCDQGPAGLVNGLALTQLSNDKIDRIAALISEQIPVQSWPREFFQVQDNIHKTGLLLSNPILSGESLKAAFSRGSMETLAELGHSGLRGRGGAGFATAKKWQFCLEQAQTERYVVCNADEGEPGTFKDRVLLNTYAHQVFEGMTLCAYIIGAKQGFVYLRMEYLHLFTKLQRILAQRRKQNLLGQKILGQTFNFDIDIRLGAGAYICGEESALIESLEGKPGIPRNRPPYPVECGYLNRPTVVNNVETFAAAAAIAIHGGDWFSASGTAKSKGSKILSISGDCARPGIYEYDFGTAIKDILADCGASNTLGVQVGGPSGCFISNREYGRKLAYEDLSTGGSFMVFNPDRNVIDIARNFSHFFAHESCGFCTPCRVGTSLLSEQLDKITIGHGSAGDIVELERLCQLVKTSSHCGLGQTAANPILSTLSRYPELYQQLLKDISFQPGFDLDSSLANTRELTQRDDAEAHLSQTGD